METWKGGCLCGAVRYECLNAPLAMGFCHCRSCQRSTGAGHIAWMLVKKEDLNITADFKEYHSKGGTGGNVYRGFCDNCGSRLFFRGDSLDVLGAQSISAASLDDPSLFQPSIRLYTSEAQPWDGMQDGCKKFAEGFVQE